jgi:hypothetical protein
MIKSQSSHCDLKDWPKGVKEVEIMINLHQKSLMLLRKILEEHNSGLVSIIEQGHDSDLNEEFYNELRDIVLDELLLKGFEKNSTPTKYGIELENLIDEIGRLFL